MLLRACVPQLPARSLGLKHGGWKPGVSGRRQHRKLMKVGFDPWVSKNLDAAAPRAPYHPVWHALLSKAPVKFSCFALLAPNL